ncbi:hypothetical protein SKAU_G00282990 [Synaphobranchus kaupii]|uniref:Uncharacterized protein n=1 Tax=Synaphobranchus kaupii TaxID=118154 RepID=A0A9Q1IP69_SYNKA|nr:hypothetical protein SKAU_G00282990 [Synaphobranchus kaupii]
MECPAVPQHAYLVLAERGGGDGSPLSCPAVSRDVYLVLAERLYGQKNRCVIKVGQGPGRAGRGVLFDVPLEWLQCAEDRRVKVRGAPGCADF